MTPHALRFAALLTAGALAGCGDKPKPSDPGGKKDEVKPLVGDPTKGDPKAEPKVEPKVDVAAGVGKEAVEFLKAVADGTADPDRLSAGFARLVGASAVLLPSEKEAGYSRAAAAGWLRGVGRGGGFGLPATATRVGDVALFRGGLIGKSGGYALRLVHEGGRWKADWLSLSSVAATAPPAATADGVLQGFAAAAVVEAMCDKDVMPRDERVAAVAAGLTPSLRAGLAAPLDGDKALGYSPAKLGWKVDEIGGKAEAVSLTPVGDAGFRAEVTRAGGAKAAYLVKVAKGPTPGQWLVDGITPQ